MATNTKNTESSEGNITILIQESINAVKTIEMKVNRAVAEVFSEAEPKKTTINIMGEQKTWLGNTRSLKKILGNEIYSRMHLLSVMEIKYNANMEIVKLLNRITGKEEIIKNEDKS